MSHFVATNIGALPGEKRAPCNGVMEKMQAGGVFKIAAGVKCVQVDTVINDDWQSVANLPFRAAGDNLAPKVCRAAQGGGSRIEAEIGSSRLVDGRGRRGSAKFKRERLGGLNRHGKVDGR